MKDDIYKIVEGMMQYEKSWITGVAPEYETRYVYGGPEIGLFGIKRDLNYWYIYMVHGTEELLYAQLPTVGDANHITEIIELIIKF